MLDCSIYFGDHSATIACKINKVAFFGPVLIQIGKGQPWFTTFRGRTGKPLVLAFPYMGCESRIFEFHGAFCTFEFHLVKTFNNKSVWSSAWLEICSAIRAFILLFGPLGCAFIAVYLMALTALNQIWRDYVEANWTSKKCIEGLDHSLIRWYLTASFLGINCIIHQFVKSFGFILCYFKLGRHLSSN